MCRLGRYDPVAIEQIWSQHRTCVGARVAQGSSHALPFAARLTSDVVGDAMGGRLRRALHAAGLPAEPAGAQQAREQARTQRHARRAIELRQMLTELGPTFIKFGQVDTHI